MAETPDSDFQALLERIRYRSERIARYLTGDTYPRRWMLPPLRGWNGDPLEITDIKKPFDREAINTEADSDFSGEGTVGVGAGKTLEICYIAMMERAFRIRHMTPIRAMMHAAGRRSAHGNNNGIHTGDILTYIQDMLKSGASS